jgi:hypothetical protein
MIDKRPLSKSPSLDERISAALGNGHSNDSGTLAELIYEVQAAATQADKVAKVQRERALAIDNADFQKARDAAADAELEQSRYAATLPRLRQCLEQALADERHERALVDYRRVEAQRDALVKEFDETYPQHYTALLDLFVAMAACDRECQRINSMMSEIAGEHRRLKSVERVARDCLDGFTTAKPSILESTRLFNLDSGEQVWPQPTPSIAASYAASMMPAPHRGGDWWRDLPAKHEQQQREQDDVGAFNERREQGREAKANEQQK